MSEYCMSVTPGGTELIAYSSPDSIILQPVFTNRESRCASGMDRGTLKTVAPIAPTANAAIK